MAVRTNNTAAGSLQYTLSSAIDFVGYTFMGWFWMPATPGSNATMFAIDDGGGGGVGLQLTVDSIAGAVTTFSRGPGSGGTVFSSIPLVWTFYAVRIDSQTSATVIARRYSDAAFTQVSVPGLGTGNTCNTIWLGRYVGGEAADVVLDGFQVYTKPFSDDQIRARSFYRKPMGGVEPFMAPYLESIGGVGKDYVTGIGRNFTVNGTFIRSDGIAPILNWPAQQRPAQLNGAPPPISASPVILTAPVQTPAILLPPTTSLLSGAGQAAQPPVIVAPPLTVSVPRIPGTPPTTQVLAGANAVPPPLSIVTLPPLVPSLGRQPTLAPGAGSAAAVPVVFAPFLLPPTAALPPATSILPGANPPATPFAGLQQAIMPFLAALPPKPSVVAGAGQAAQPPALLITQSLLAPVTSLPPAALIQAGAGQASQAPAILITQPLLPPVALAPPTALILGGANPPATSFSGIQQAVLQALTALLPPKSSVVIGAGQAAQPPVIVTVPFQAPVPVVPPLVQTIVPGGGWISPPPPTVYQQPFQAPVAKLPSVGSILAGFGQAAQAPSIVSAPLQAPGTRLPPTQQTLTGVALSPPPPPLFQANQPPVPYPPRPPVLIIGAGQAAQPAVVLAVSSWQAPYVSLPPKSSVIQGAGTQVVELGFVTFRVIPLGSVLVRFQSSTFSVMIK